MVALLASAEAASAAKVRVTTELDEFGGPTPLCSLREAVQTTNSNADFGGCVRKGQGNADTIRLTGGTTYTRSLGGSAEDANTAGDLDVFGRTTIDVTGEGRATINADLIDRAIKVHDGHLSASRLVITRGSPTPNPPDFDTGGGGISVDFDASLDLRSSRLESNVTPGTSNCACGGGIVAGGEVTLRKVSIEGNGAENIGGGLAKTGSTDVRIANSRIIDNDASGTGGGGLYLGGTGGRVTIDRSTIAENNALDFTFGNGAGVRVSGPRVVMTNSTVSGNEAQVSGGGIFGGNLKLNGVTIHDNVANVDANSSGSGGGLSVQGTKARNSIIAGNFDFSPSDPENECDGQLTGKPNLLGLNFGCSVDPASVVTADPKLMPLADNGGFTETHALRKSSPAIGLASGSVPNKDQRGVNRDSHPDVGAYER